MINQNNIYLKENDLTDIDKLDEYNKEYSIFKGFKPFATPDNYEQVIENNKKLKLGIGNNGIKEIYYWGIEGNKIVGHASIRLNPEIDESCLKYCGHIMYGVVPSKRKNGYGTIICHLLIEKMKEFGYEELIITCNEDNLASSLVIQNNGGRLIELVDPDMINTIHKTKRYLINIKESIKQYNEKFNSKIK